MDTELNAQTLRAENERLSQELENAKKQLRKITRKYDILLMEKEQAELNFEAEKNLQNAMLGERMRQGDYLDLLLKNSKEVILIFDKHARLLYMTDDFLRLLGAESTDEFSGRTMFDILAGRFGAELAAAAYERFERMSLLMQTVRDDVEMTGANGKPLHMQCCYTPLITDDGDFDGALAVYYDVTELFNATEDARRANAAKNEFLASMSHEIRTPMNAIMGLSDLMRTDNFDEVQLRYISDIKRTSKSLMHIINDILDFSNIETGTFNFNVVSFDLRALFDNICSMTRFIIGDKPVTFSSEIDKRLPRVLVGDENRIRQVVTNLLGNAAKYTEKGSLRLTVGLAPESGEPDSVSGVAFTVTDTGTGISEDNLPLIFEAFTHITGPDRRGTEGTGLGLAITKRLVTMMDGHISVESAEGQGSKFTIWLPLREGEPEAQESGGRKSQTAFAAEGTNVLVVDDSSINLTVALGFFARHGIDVDTADSGREAVAKVQAKHYDIIFMDHMMTEMDGVEATQRIRELGITEPIIALTANAVTGMREFFLENGMDDFLPKPIDAAELNRILLRWLPGDKLVKSAERYTPKALVADDTESGRRIISGLCKGCEVTAVSGASEVLEIIDSGKPDIIILEIAMDGGFEALRQAKSVSSAPILVVTRGADWADRAKSAGAADVVEKPFYAADVAARIKNLCAR